MYVVGDERHVQEEGEELPREEEEEVEEDVQDVLREHQRVQAVALVDGVLVVRLQLVEGDDLKGGGTGRIGERWRDGRLWLLPHVKDGEEDEERVDDEGHDVGEGGEGEGHGEGGEEEVTGETDCEIEMVCKTSPKLYFFRWQTNAAEC